MSEPGGGEEGTAVLLLSLSLHSLPFPPQPPLTCQWRGLRPELLHLILVNLTARRLLHSPIASDQPAAQPRPHSPQARSRVAALASSSAPCPPREGPQGETPRPSPAYSRHQEPGFSASQVCLASSSQGALIRCSMQPCISGVQTGPGPVGKEEARKGRGLWLAEGWAGFSFHSNIPTRLRT